jgi:hypothetical protein
LAALLLISTNPVEIVGIEVFSIMRFRTALTLAALSLLCFTVAVWSTPLDAQAPAQANATTETQTVTGKISSVGDAGFTMEVKQNQKESTLQFLVDGNTKVDGKLSVGAQATVDYHSEGGRNIATHVVVPMSGMQSQ